LLDRLLYMNPADDLANQFLKSHCDVNLQPEIEKKRQIVKKELNTFSKKNTFHVMLAVFSIVCIFFFKYIC
jgi:hypothetical protein